MDYLYKCPLCSNDFKTFDFTAIDPVTKNKFKLAQCSICDIIFTNPRPSEEQTEEYYPEEYYAHSGEPSLIEKIDSYLRQKKIQDLDLADNQTKILDIGCGKGLLLERLASLGWEAYGTEISEKTAKGAKAQKSGNVHIGKLSEQLFPAEHFNVVTLWHVLEHLPDPFESLCYIHKILENKGYLIVQVPDISSMQAGYFKATWLHLDVPLYSFHYSPYTLFSMLDKAEFEVVYKKYSYLPYDLFGNFQSSLNMLTRSHNVFNELIKNKSKDRKKKINILNCKLFYHASLVPMAIFMSVGMFIMSRITNKGCGTLEIHARKR